MNPKTVQNKAERITDSLMEQAAAQSIYDGQGNLRPDASRFANNGSMGLGEYLNLASIPWAPEPDGSEHATHLARLAEYMGTLPGPFGGVVGGPFDKQDQRCLHAVSMLYAVGKGSMGDGEVRGQHGYAERSAAWADQYLRGPGAAGTIWGKVEMRESICRLIRWHNDEREIKLDKRLQVFADAVRYELCRLNTNTASGMRLLKEQWSPALFNTGWAANKANARAYMVSRGWK